MTAQHRFNVSDLPFAVTFFCALFIFLHALSGTGYAEYQFESLLSSPLSYSHLLGANAASKPEGFGGFNEHWEHFKEAFLSCPSAVRVGNTDGAPAEGRASTSGGGNEESSAKSPEQDAIQPDMDCVKERLKDAISKFKFNGSSFAQEERTFRLSFDGIPSSYSRNEDSPDPDP